jgi:hypothetical protein
MINIKDVKIGDFLELSLSFKQPLDCSFIVIKKEIDKIECEDVNGWDLHLILEQEELRLYRRVSKKRVEKSIKGLEVFRNKLNKRIGRYKKYLNKTP